MIWAYSVNQSTTLYYKLISQLCRAYVTYFYWPKFHMFWINIRKLRWWWGGGGGGGWINLPPRLPRSPGYIALTSLTINRTLKEPTVLIKERFIYMIWCHSASEYLKLISLQLSDVRSRLFLSRFSNRLLSNSDRYCCRLKKSQNKFGNVVPNIRTHLFSLHMCTLLLFYVKIFHTKTIKCFCISINFFLEQITHYQLFVTRYTTQAINFL